MDNVIPIKDVPFGMHKWTSRIVQEKQQVTSARSTPTKKQKFIFVDPEGSKVEGIIFNTDIPVMGPRIEVYKSYLISNAEVKRIPDEFKTPGISARWIISARTVIEEVMQEEDLMPFRFSYTEFKDLSQYMDQKDKSVGELFFLLCTFTSAVYAFRSHGVHYKLSNVLGIVVTALEKKLVVRKSEESYVQKFVLVNEEYKYQYAFDFTSLQPIMLSMWDAFIENEGARIIAKLRNYPVIVGRRLKVSNYNGVALTTWFDSAVLIDPPVQEARAMKNWAMRNYKFLADIVNQETYNRYNPDISFQADQKITDIINITPSQRAVWVKALFFFENIFQKFWYMSCEKCFRSTTADHGVTFMCNTCKKKYKAQPRCRLDVDLTDATGTITTTLFGDLAEQLLSFTAVEVMEHFNQNMELPLEKLHQELKSKIFIAHIKSVQTPLADGKRRYTMQHYKEYSNTDSHPVKIAAECSSLRAKTSLIQKFNESDDAEQTDVRAVEGNALKKTKLN